MSQQELNQAMALIDAGRLEDARVILARLLQRHPSNGAVCNALGILHAQKGEFEQAIFFARRAVEAFPGVADPRLNLAQMLSYHARHDEAIAEFKAALALDASHPSAWHRYGAALARANHYADANAALQRGLSIAPADHNLLIEQAHVLLMRGRAHDAVQMLLTCLHHHPHSSQAARLLAFASVYDAKTTPAQAFQAARLHGELLSAEITRGGTLPPADPPSGPERRLRVGLVSPDFREHAVARFLVALFEGTDPTRIEWCCYSNSLQDDGMTAYFRGKAAIFRKMIGQGALHAARVIRADGVDVLIDLAGHTAHSAVALFAHTPAPVQGTYLGYPQTLGMPAVTFRLVDSCTDPVGEPYDAQGFASERLVRLEPCFLCYTPNAAAPPVAPPAFERTGRITFGSFNGYQKIGDDLLGLWARVVQGVPGSHLLIKNFGLKQEESRTDLAARFVKAGLAEDQFTLAGPVADQQAHLGAYADVDLALDTFPYNGTTTTCEALYMGVPVIGVRGQGHAARVGFSLLTAAGVPEWCAPDPEAFVTRAIDLAGDRSRLREYRESLRPRLTASALMDSKAFATRFEGAIRGVWREACGGVPGR